MSHTTKLRHVAAILTRGIRTANIDYMAQDSLVLDRDAQTPKQNLVSVTKENNGAVLNE